MAMNRIQFQPGLSLAGFLQQYGTEAACARALRRARWPKGFVCPRCGGRRYGRCANRHGERMWQCSACRHQTTLRSGTLFEATKLPLRTWFLALYLLTQSKTNLAALELMRHLGVCYRTAWRVKHKLMQAMTEREAGRQLGGLVQIDDAYLGGERNGGKPGRGSENKRPFVIAVELSEEGHPRHAVTHPRRASAVLKICSIALRATHPAGRGASTTALASDAKAPSPYLAEGDVSLHQGTSASIAGRCHSKRSMPVVLTDDWSSASPCLAQIQTPGNWWAPCQ